MRVTPAAMQPIEVIKKKLCKLYGGSRKSIMQIADISLLKIPKIGIPNI